MIQSVNEEFWIKEKEMLEKEKEMEGRTRET